MLEDVLGWIVVLVGAIVMKFTDFALLDPIMSIGVAAFILVNTIKNLKEAIDIFLEKTPSDTDISEIISHVGEIEGVLGVHHVHVWTIDGQNKYATMHIVSNTDHREVKEHVREELREHGICHATLELETEDEHCGEENCRVEFEASSGHHHHHHHHHHHAH